jgi:nucleoid-associated protein YgaU
MSVVTHKAEVQPQVRVGVPVQRTTPAVRRVSRHRPPTRQRVAGAPRVLTRALCAPRQARLSLVWVLAVASVACAAVVGLGALSSSVGPTVPADTTVVRVKPGENLWDVAGRVAPDSNADAVVERIQELNSIDGAVEPGQPLTVPFER